MDHPLSPGAFIALAEYGYTLLAQQSDTMDQFAYNERLDERWSELQFQLTELCIARETRAESDRLDQILFSLVYYIEELDAEMVALLPARS